MGWINFLSLLLLFGNIAADHCPVGNWVTIGGICYLFSSQKLTWQEAMNDCQKYNPSATLLQFYSTQDKANFLNATIAMSVERWWTSLNENQSPGTFLWGPKGYGVRPKNGIVVWNLEPDDTRHLENCGAISIQATISDEDCSERHGYICEYLTTDDGCPDGWILFNNSCYYISDITDPFSNIPWSDATGRCNSLVANNNVHLLQLETKAENDFLLQQLPFIQTSSSLWWIGMTDQKVEGRWLWVDGSLVNQQSINWALEPDNLGGQEHCGMMYNSGVFSDKPCDALAYYVCQASPLGDSPILNRVGCPAGWIRAGHKCYKFQTGDLKTWDAASASCSANGGRLLQIQNKDEKTWIELQTRYYKSSPFWSGLTYHIDQKTWYWSTGIQADMNLVIWNSEPNNFAGDEDCAVIMQDGVFNDMSCMSKLGYICEMHLEDSACPNGWYTYFDGDQDSCYFISNSTDVATWDEAKDKCQLLAKPEDAALVALNSPAEVTKVNQLLKQQSLNYRGWWTGLNDIGTEGAWVYYTPYDNQPGSNVKINWNSEPSNPDTDRCAEIYFGGRYNDVNCKNNVSYICETDAQQKIQDNPQTSNGFHYLPFYLNTALMVIICWLY